MTDTLTRLAVVVVAAVLITAGLWNLFGWPAAAIWIGAVLITVAVLIPDLATLRKGDR